MYCKALEKVDALLTKGTCPRFLVMCPLLIALVFRFYSVLGSAVIALTQIVLTVFAGIESVRARLPRFNLPISPKRITRMTQTLFHELQHSSLAELMEQMDTTGWYRFFTSLTEAASTESHSTLEKLSCTNLLRAGTRILEGWDIHRAGTHEAEE